jgi:hypothetical protein
MARTALSERDGPRPSLSGRRAAVVGTLTLAALAFSSLCIDVTSASPAAPGPFRWFTPARAPSGWKQASLPSVGAVLSYPPSLQPTRGDTGAISVAEKDARGRILVYLNATPKQGDERLNTWPQYRLQHNRGESDAVHEDARAFGLPFVGGTGSCVIDDYLTRVKVNHYREIACFVQGPGTASVLVASALQSAWTREAALLEQAVDAYRAA